MVSSTFSECDRYGFDEIEKSVMPVPVSETVNPGSSEPSEMLMLPDLVPAAVGTKVTLMAHVAWVASGYADMHVLVCEKSPDRDTPDM
jgi:hypothetical protein